MKKIASLLTTSLLLAGGAYAAPFLAVGDGAEIFLTGDVSARADSNIFLAPSSTKDRSDTVFEATPGLELVFGKTATVQGSWSVQENFSSYSDHSDLNSSLFSTSFAAGFTDGKSKGSVNAGFAETNQNQVGDINGIPNVDFLIHRKSTNAGATGEVAISEKTTVATGVQYAKADYERTGFFDTETLTVPVNVYYEVTPKVDAGVGYQYRRSWAEGNAPDATDNFFNVSARGEFTPKLSGKIAVGLTERSYARLKDASLLGVDASLSYVASPKSIMQFGVSNDFDTNAQGEQQKNFALNASVQSNISEQWAVSAGLSYRAIDYFKAAKPRTDDYVEARIGATYIVNANVRVTGSYTYRNNRSDLPTSKFDDSVLTISANFRY